MAVRTIECPECGFTATYVGAGKRGELNEELLEKARLCVKADSYKDAKACPAFAATINATLGFTV